jgi:hypothetical protein
MRQPSVPHLHIKSGISLDSIVLSTGETAGYLNGGASLGYCFTVSHMTEQWGECPNGLQPLAKICVVRSFSHGPAFRAGVGLFSVRDSFVQQAVRISLEFKDSNIILFHEAKHRMNPYPTIVRLPLTSIQHAGNPVGDLPRRILVIPEPVPSYMTIGTIVKISLSSAYAFVLAVFSL